MDLRYQPTANPRLKNVAQVEAKVIRSAIDTAIIPLPSFYKDFCAINTDMLGLFLPSKANRHRSSDGARSRDLIGV